MFNEICESYSNYTKEFDSLFYENAFEATENDSLEDNKSTNGNTIFEKIKLLIDKIISMIERALLNLKNKYQKVLLTDKGFKAELRDAEVNRKPLNGTRLITYSYVPEILNSVNVQFKQMLNDAMTDITDINDNNSILNAAQEDFNAYVFKTLNAPDNIDDMNLYFSYIRKKFRGEKAEKTIMASSLPYHIKIAESYSNLKLILDTDLATYKTKINTIASKLKLITMNNNTPDTEKTTIIKKFRNLSQLYTMYSSFCQINMELRVEQMLNSRIIVKRLYSL